MVKKKISKIDGKIEDEFSAGMKDTFSERLEQGIVNFIGSWLFLLLNIVFFVLWLILKLSYNQLTFWVSLEAIVLSVLILINANKETGNDRKRAIKDYKIDMSVAQRAKGIEREIKEIKEKINWLAEKMSRERRAPK